MLDGGRPARIGLFTSLVVTAAGACASPAPVVTSSASQPSAGARSLPVPAGSAEAVAPPSKPAGQVTRLDVIFQTKVSDVRAEEIIRSLQEPGRERLDEATFGGGPVFVVDAPEGRRQAIVDRIRTFVEVKEVRPSATVELVVYFQKGVTEDQAALRLRALGHPFHTGADSSKGKEYFYASGPPFIVNVPVSALDAFTEACAKLPAVKEVYEADKSVQKD